MQPFITTGPVKTMIVLGSGGHTAEMLMLLESMDRAFYCPRVYVAANTDHMSATRALSREQEWAVSKVISRENYLEYFADICSSSHACCSGYR